VAQHAASWDDAAYLWHVAFRAGALRGRHATKSAFGPRAKEHRRRSLSFLRLLLSTPLAPREAYVAKSLRYDTEMHELTGEQHDLVQRTPLLHNTEDIEVAMTEYCGTA
jgi:hypothetical protein